MKKLLFITLATLILGGCTQGTENIDIEIKETPKVQGESKLNADYLINNYWLGSSTGFLFSEPNSITSQIRGEVDCQPNGTFDIEGNEVLIEFTECPWGDEFVSLSLGEDEEDMRFTEFLIDQNGEKYYNTSSTYPIGTKKEFSLNEKNYVIEIIGLDLKVSEEVRLYKMPSIESPFYVDYEYDDRNVTSQTLNSDDNQFVGKYESDQGTWYLVNPIRVIYGGWWFHSDEGDGEVEGDIPYTWVHEKHLAI